MLTRSTMWPIVACTSDRSTLDTFGCFVTTSRCSRATCVASGTRASTANCFGAASIAAVGNTAKKLSSKRSQSIWRRLATRVGTRAPCTSHTIRSPTLTPRFAARSRSSDTP